MDNDTRPKELTNDDTTAEVAAAILAAARVKGPAQTGVEIPFEEGGGLAHILGRYIIRVAAATNRRNGSKR